MNKQQTIRLRERISLTIHSIAHKYPAVSLEIKVKFLTGSHLVLQRGCAILHQLLQWQCRIRQVQIQQTLHFLGMMELQHTFTAIVLRANIVQENVDDFQEEFLRLGIGSHICWKNVCKISIFSFFNFHISITFARRITAIIIYHGDKENMVLLAERQTV